MTTIGFYADCDDALCLDCVGKAELIENPPNREFPWWDGFEGWPAPLAIDDGEESDSPTHCCECGTLLEHDLTPDGYDYVAEAILQGFAEGRQNPVTVQWIGAYADYMGDEMETADSEVHTGDAITLYRLLPRDPVWSERAELRKHALQAGWIENGDSDAA